MITIFYIDYFESEDIKHRGCVRTSKKNGQSYTGSFAPNLVSIRRLKNLQAVSDYLALRTQMHTLLEFKCDFWRDTWNSCLNYPNRHENA